MDFRKFYIPTVMAGLALLISANQAQAQTGVLDGYWGSDSSQHVNFIGTDGHVHELYIHPGAGWVNNDLTLFSGVIIDNGTQGIPSDN